MVDNWIVPCNVKYFNIIDHFKINSIVVWKNSFTIREGDTAYIYLSAPYSEIRYKCRVISTSVDEETLAANSYAIQEKTSNNYFSKKIKYMKMQLEFEYPSGLLTRQKLIEQGLGQVQIQARTDRSLQNYIEAMTRELELEKEGERT